MKAVFFVTASVVLLVLTAVWIGGLIYTIQNYQEWGKGAVQGTAVALVLTGLLLLSAWGTWFAAGFRAMGARDEDL